MLAASLALGLASFLTARADLVVMDNDFNNATNNLANNDLGIGGGYTSFTAVQGQVRELNSQAQVASINNGADRAVFASQNYADISAAGTVFEFTNVTFTNTTTTGAPLTDRLILGVISTNLAADWFESGLASTPQGFYFEPNSEGLATSTSAGNNNTLWTNHNSVFYYKGPGTNITILQRFQFKTLSWNNGPGNWTNYSPVLDVKITLSATGWKFDITGDVNTNGQPISFSGTYAGSGITNIDFMSGIDHPYIGGEDQTEGPCIRMSVDRILVTHLGNLIVTTPAFSTPEYGGNVNTVFAGEAVSLSSFVTDSVATPTLQWQMADLSNPGAFTNLPSGNGPSVSVNTSGLGDSQPRGIRLVASDGMGNSVTSAVVNLTANPASAPIISQDITPSFVNLYVGEGFAFTATFIGDKPMSFQWQRGPDGITYTNIPNATNNVYVIASATASDAGWYLLVASNAYGTGQSSGALVTVGAGVPEYLWSAPVPFAGLDADQVLTNFPSTNKIAGALVGKNGGAPITVTPSSGSPIVFAGNGAGWAVVSGGNGYGTGANTNNTGNANFNTCLNDYYYDGGVQIITMSNLVVGQQYQVQLFALDDRGQYKARQINWQDPIDSADFSTTYTMGDHSYLLAAFTASNSVQSIRQNQIANAGNFNCLVLRAVGWNPPPYFTTEPASGRTYANTSFSFSGTAAGDSTIPNPTIIYQWAAGPAGGPYTNLVEGSKYNGTTTATLTISNLTASDGIPVYVIQASNGGGTTTSREATLNVVPLPAQNLVGEWLAGTTNLADVSGFSPAGTHDGYFVGANNITVVSTNVVGTNTTYTTNNYFAPLPGTNYWFTSDVPPGRTGMAMHLVNIAIAITNSSTLDSSYINTYDDIIHTNFTVMFWAKGAPGAFSWNPWLSKYGENNVAWQFRVGGANDAAGNPVPCWTVRDGSAGSYSVVGAGPSWSMGGDQDDMHAAISGTGGGAAYFGVNNSTWHHYAGTYDLNTGVRNLYVDGVLRAREINNVQYTLSPASHVVIGGRDSGGNAFGNFFTGNLYDVRIYTSALTEPQIVNAGRIPPTLTAQTIRALAGGGGQQVLTWSWGTLLEATNILGPWTTNNATSPYTNNMTLPQEYFRGQLP